MNSQRRTEIRAYTKNANVIDKRTLGEARASLRRSLKQYEDEPLSHKLGPPSVFFDPTFHGVPRELTEKFWELMVKEGVVVVHPFGGFMHPRFVGAEVPTKEQVRDNLKEHLEENGLTS